jgi:hypothetical protein
MAQIVQLVIVEEVVVLGRLEALVVQVPVMAALVLILALPAVQ